MNIFFKKYLCLGYFTIAIALSPDIAQADTVSSDSVYGNLSTLNSITFASTTGTSGTAIPYSDTLTFTLTNQ